jgi:peptide/nickel transport system substrate-binding protein
MSIHIRRTIFLMLLSAVMLLLAACPAQPVAVPVPGEPAAPVTPADAVRAQTLNIAINARIADPTNFNLYAPGVSRANLGLHQVVYEYFFYQNLETGEFIPWLAEGYEYDDDYQTITVTLREGVTWSDGEPFTADDVAFTYDLLLNNPGMIWASEVVANVESVEAIDDLTVQFNLLESNPRYHLNREAFPAVGIWGGITILPQHVWEGEDPVTFRNNPPIGTGAYTLATAAEAAITYERNENWWGTEVWDVTPPAETINFTYVGPETSVALALAANDLDTPNIGILSVGSFLSVMARNPNVGAWLDAPPYAWVDPCPRGLLVQHEREPWNEPAARKALTHLIDREAIINLAYEGTTLPAWGVWPLYTGLLPYFDAISDLIDEHAVDQYDPDRAEEYFAEIGYERGPDGYFAQNGVRLTVNLVANADSPESMRVAQVLADQLDAGGIEIEFQSLAGSVRDTAILRGDYDIYPAQAFCPGYIYENLELFHSKFYAPLGELAPWYERNSFRYQNEAFDAIVDQMLATPPDDEAQLIDLYRQAMEIWFDDLPIVPLTQAPALVPFNTTYWEGWPSAENPWIMPVSWWATFNLVLNGYPDPDTGEWVEGIRRTGQ